MKEENKITTKIPHWKWQFLYNLIIKKASFLNRPEL